MNDVLDTLTRQAVANGWDTLDLRVSSPVVRGVKLYHPPTDVAIEVLEMNAGRAPITARILHHRREVAAIRRWQDVGPILNDPAGAIG
jgi:hypothetical protein